MREKLPMHFAYACILSALTIPGCFGGRTASTGQTSGSQSPDTAGPPSTSGAMPQGATVSFDACSGREVQEGNSALQLQGNANFTVGKQGCAIELDGVTGSAKFNATVVNSDASFSLAAWIMLSEASDTATVLSQDGNTTSAYALRYPGLDSNSQTRGMQFVLRAADSANAAQVIVQSEIAMPLHVWTHVAATFDEPNQVASIYINGVLAAQESGAVAFLASGNTQIGRELFNGKPGSFWAGRIDEVSIVPAVLAASDISALMAKVPSTTPIRPPATPLSVRGPYVSTWLAADQAPGTWPSFWNGATKALTIALRVDGAAYAALGSPNLVGMKKAVQQQLEVTPTQTKFVFTAAGVALYLHFTGAMDPGDLKGFSAPFSSFSLQAQSIDGGVHDVQLYVDSSAESAFGNTTANVTWQRVTIANGLSGLQAYAAAPAAPGVLAETADYPNWGTMVLATQSAGVTVQDGIDAVVRQQFITNGALDNSTDAGQPRAISDRWPVFAFATDVPKLKGSLSTPLTFVMGHVRSPAVSYMTTALSPLWQTYWSNWQGMAADTFNNASTGTMLARNEQFDSRIHTESVAIGGAHYGALCAVALRQAFGGVELVNMAGQIWMFSKAISNDGSISTIDNLYASMPAYVYTNPLYLSYLLNPIFAYSETGNWPNPFAVRDLGVAYPNAGGHNDGGGEVMPVEASASMVLMTAVYAKLADPVDAKNYVTAHYPMLRKWTEYLFTNSLDPALQIQSDDFAGPPFAHCTNLALKGIVAIGAMGQLATLVGNAADAKRYGDAAGGLMLYWQQLSLDPSGDHLKLASDQNNTWSLKYNAYPDRLLGLNLLPENILALETAWYATQSQKYGTPLDSRHTYAKLDWQMWMAAAIDDAANRNLLIDQLYRYVNETSSRVPLSDWFDTVTGQQAGQPSGYSARPVVGGVFSLLARHAAGTLPQ